jgi:hypothetical protein
MIPAHDQAVTHSYRIHYPEHGPRQGDPHYVDFDHIRRRERATARCYIGERIGFQECRDARGNPALPVRGGAQPGLELHHAHIEWALVNGVDLAALEVDYPGVSNPDEVGAWTETAANLRWLCAWHHRGVGAGAHSGDHSDWEASAYVPGLLGKPR